MGRPAALRPQPAVDTHDAAKEIVDHFEETYKKLRKCKGDPVKVAIVYAQFLDDKKPKDRFYNIMAGLIRAGWTVTGLHKESKGALSKTTISRGK
jgi:FMN phosphatase YigB (HAD superfamily)